MICWNIKGLFHPSYLRFFWFSATRLTFLGQLHDFSGKSYIIHWWASSHIQDLSWYTCQRWNGMTIIKRKDSIALGFCGLVSVLNGDLFIMFMFIDQCHKLLSSELLLLFQSPNLHHLGYPGHSKRHRQCQTYLSICWWSQSRKSLGFPILTHRSCFTAKLKFESWKWQPKGIVM